MSGQPTSRVTIGALLGLSLGVLVFGALAAYAEATPYFARGATIQQKHAAIGEGAARPGWSSFSAAVFLADCLAVVQSPIALVQSAESRRRFLEACRDISLNATAATPSNGQAWVVGAAIATQLELMQEASHMLVAGQRMTPFVHWLAAARVNLSEAYHDVLDEEARAAEFSDLAVLLDSDQGIKSLALTYTGRSTSQERITSVVERASPEIQQLFLREVRRALAQ